MRSRILLPLLLLVLTTVGCLEASVRPSGVDPQGKRDDVVLAADGFASPGAPLLAARVTGCGFCVGRSDYQSPEHQSIAVFENGRVALVRFNFAAGGNETRLHVRSGLDFDQTALRAAVVPPGTWGSGGLYVAEVETFRLERGFNEVARAVNEGWIVPENEGVVNCQDCSLPTYLRAMPPTQARIDARHVASHEPFARVVQAFNEINAALPSPGLDA